MSFPVALACLQVSWGGEVGRHSSALPTIAARGGHFRGFCSGEVGIQEQSWNLLRQSLIIVVAEGGRENGS